MNNFLKTSLRVAVLIAAAGLTVTCTTTPVQTDVKAEIDKVCQRQQFGFGEPLDPSSAKDSVVARRFGQACKELLRQDGLDFGNGTTVYTCRVFLPRLTELPPPEKLKEYESRFKDKKEFNEILEANKAQIEKSKASLAGLEVALGQSLTLNSFNDAAGNPEDLTERLYARQGNAVQSSKGMPIGYSSTYDGLAATLILLADFNGEVGRVVYSREELNGSLRSVRSITAAIDLIAMRKLAGLGNDLLEPSHDPWPLCHAGSVTADQAGWTIRDVEILPECQNSIIQDYRVQKTGETLISESA